MTVRVLVSYHYHRNTDLDELTERFGGDVDLFADSGAYSAFTSGAEIDREQYATWLDRWDHLLDVKANLDVIGDPAAGADNLAYLRSRGHDVLPVFHIGEPFDVLREQCDTAPYVALGGLVPHLANGAANRNRPQIMKWLIKSHLIARKTGTVLHGFGCTGSLFLRNLPFYSTDSSSYMFARKRCLMYLWDERRMVLTTAHFRDQGMVRKHAHLLRLYGMDPGRALHPEFMVSGTDHFDDDRIEVTAVCIRSYLAMEKFFRARHNVPTPLTGCSTAAVTGTKIYFVNVNGSRVDVEPIARVAREGLL